MCVVIHPVTYVLWQFTPVLSTCDDRHQTHLLRDRSCGNPCHPTCFRRVGCGGTSRLPAWSVRTYKRQNVSRSWQGREQPSPYMARMNDVGWSCRLICRTSSPLSPPQAVGVSMSSAVRISVSDYGRGCWWSSGSQFNLIRKSDAYATFPLLLCKTLLSMGGDSKYL